MSRKLSIGVLAGTLLLSGMLVGVSYGGGGGITQPEVITLTGTSGDLRAFPLRNADGKRALITILKEGLDDVDGAAVGNHRWNCVGSHGYGQVCNDVIHLKQGAHTERGSITVAGEFRGYNGESWAVTGGTGAYVNVRGHLTLSVEGGEFTQTLYLIP